MVACSACGAQPAYRPTYTKLAYCQEHFLALIEKRVRKDLRLSQPVDLQQAYHVLDDGSPAAALLKRLLDRIFSDRLQVDDQAKRVIEPACLEEDVSERFSLFLEKKPLQIAALRPLRTVAAADIAFLTGENILVKGHPLLATLEAKQPGTFFAMGNILREKE